MEAKEVKGLWEAYVSVYTNLSESHFKVGDKVICKKSGMKGEVVKLDKPDGAEDEKYYTVKREDGKKMKYAPNELKSAGDGGASKEKETKFHTKLDKLVHSTFGSSPEEKKMKEEFDIFDVILEHLVAEGYADTNQAALAIMANMSEEWKQDIVEGMTMDEFKKQRRRQKDEPPIRKRGGLSAPEGERSIGGEANRRNKDYWASVVGKNRDRGAGNKAKRRAAEMG